MDYTQAIKDYLAKHQNGNPAMGSTLGDKTKGLEMLANQAVEPSTTSANMAQALRAGNTDAQAADQVDHYADGGVVDAPPPQFDPNAGMPPAPAAPPVAPVGNADDITKYIGQQKQQLGNYGPEQQMAVSKNLLGAQNSTQGRVANAGAGLADALMQGVARAGNPGFQQNLQNRQQAQAGTQMEALKGAREANVQNVGANEKLDAQDPASPLSASKRAQNGPILTAMGFNPKTIGQMSAADMDTTMNLLKDFRGKDLEVAVARMKAQIEANQLHETSRHNVAEEANKSKELAQTGAHQTAEEGLKGQEIGAGELEKSAAEPLMSRLAGMVGMNPAGKALQDQALEGTGNQVMTATNSMGHQIKSTDGGKTWK